MSSLTTTPIVPEISGQTFQTLQTLKPFKLFKPFKPSNPITIGTNSQYRTIERLELKFFR